VSEHHKFLFEGLPVRGHLMRLTDDWQELLRRRAEAGDAFAPPVRGLLGEMTAAAALMQANIRFEGALILQVFGDGPVKLAVVEVQSDLAFRATAKVIGAIEPDAGFAAMLNRHGQGRCAITLDPADKREGRQTYQGVVSLQDDTHQALPQLAGVLEHYMLQSEQLETRLVLAADDTVAAGLLLQRLPVEGSGNLAPPSDEDRATMNEAFNRIAQLSATLTRAELLTLDADTLLRRLFWEEPLHRFEPQPAGAGPRFACSCTRARVGRMLKSLGRAEIDGIITEQGRVEIACDFCALKYHFDPVDVGELFTPTPDQMPGSGAIN
jgi:molecular chaperone Hsp33